MDRGHYANESRERRDCICVRMSQRQILQDAIGGDGFALTHIYVGDLFLDSTLASLLEHPHLRLRLRLHFRLLRPRLRLYLRLRLSPHSHPRLRLRLRRRRLRPRSHRHRR